MICLTISMSIIYWQIVLQVKVNENNRQLFNIHNDIVMQSIKYVHFKLGFNIL